jgi:hypothetical protein
VWPGTRARRPSPAPPAVVQPAPPIAAEPPRPVLAVAPDQPAAPPAQPERRNGRTRRHHAPSPSHAPPPLEPVAPASAAPEPPRPPPPAQPRPAPPATRPPPETGRIVSGRPRDSIPAPRLPPVHQAHGAEDLARVFRLVEEETVARAEIYPAAMYYFIISEAALGHDREAAAHNLLANHKSRALRRLASLVAVEHRP